MPVKEIGDPRLEALFGATSPRDSGIRPTVRLPRRGLPPAAFAAALLVFAVLLFLVLNGRRTEQSQPPVVARAADGSANSWAPPPPLYVPPTPQPVYAAPPIEQPKPAIVPPSAPAPAPSVRTAPQAVPAPIQVAQPAPAAVTPAPQRTAAGSPLVIDTGGADVANSSNAHAASGSSSPTGSSSTQPLVRMRASALANRSMTVPQGYLIPAVLETGFDSTKPGFARAIVSRDVRGFDGKYVLIPRGSRLVGEYQSAIGQGQDRAVITWTRLIRPDGMTIEMQAPAVDPVGRGGVKASVNTHFFAKLGDALLQSTVAIGQAVAGRAVTGPVVVLPGATGSVASQVLPSASYTPTLKVAPGKSISIFVAQDLDFGSAGAGR